MNLKITGIVLLVLMLASVTVSGVSADTYINVDGISYYLHPWNEAEIEAFHDTLYFPSYGYGGYYVCGHFAQDMWHYSYEYYGYGYTFSAYSEYGHGYNLFWNGESPWNACENWYIFEPQLGRVVVRASERISGMYGNSILRFEYKVADAYGQRNIFSETFIPVLNPEDGKIYFELSTAGENVFSVSSDKPLLVFKSPQYFNTFRKQLWNPA